MKEYNLNKRGTAPKPEKVTEDTIVTFGKWKNNRMGDVDVSYLVWAWGSFLSLKPQDPMHQYIVQNIEQLDRETDGIFNPDPRKFRK